MQASEPTRARRTGAFRERLPTVVAEALSVVFAVLVALAVDEWWENRENIELGRQSVAAVAAEVRSNIDRLEGGRTRIEAIQAHMDSVAAMLAADEEPEDLTIDYPVALLSTAAWQTAQVTRAVHYVPLEVVQQIAGVYDFQSFFLRSQEQLTDAIGGVLAGEEEGPEGIMRRLRSRYRVIAGFRDALATSYRCLLVQIDEATPEEAAACTEETDG